MLLISLIFESAACGLPFFYGVMYPKDLITINIGVLIIIGILHTCSPKGIISTNEKKNLIYE